MYGKVLTTTKICDHQTNKKGGHTMTTTDSLIFTLFILAMLIFSTVTYDKVSRFEAETVKTLNLVVEVSREQTKLLAQN